MIKRGDKDVTSIYHGKAVIAAVYKGARLVWTAINSCFGSGLWFSGKFWKENDFWKEHY